LNEKGRGRDGSARAPPAADAEGDWPPGVRRAGEDGSGRGARRRASTVVWCGQAAPGAGVGGRRGRPAVWAAMGSASSAGVGGRRRGLVWAGAGAQLCVEFECVRVCAAMCGIGVVTREVCRVPVI